MESKKQTYVLGLLHQFIQRWDFEMNHNGFFFFRNMTKYFIFTMKYNSASPLDPKFNSGLKFRTGESRPPCFHIIIC